jgi:hypothetical protein
MQASGGGRIRTFTRALDNNRARGSHVCMLASLGADSEPRAALVVADPFVDFVFSRALK